jgi:hypothetical protein
VSAEGATGVHRARGERAPRAAGEARSAEASRAASRAVLARGFAREREKGARRAATQARAAHRIAFDRRRKKKDSWGENITAGKRIRRADRKANTSLPVW